MLVMPVEALRQISDPNRKPAGFHFRDVVLRKALIIPPTGSIETQLYLRSSTMSNQNFLQWSDFRICVYESEDWTEVCSGEVAIEYKKNPQDHEGAAEEEYARLQHCQGYSAGSAVCTKNVNAKDIYEHFAKLGISYGPSFATLRDVRYNNNGEATALVNLQDWKNRSTTIYRHQNHLIHPAALDAIFQTVFAALTEGATKSFPTLVPTKFRNLWIAGDLNEINEADANVFTKAKFVGFRNADSSICAISPATGKPLVVGGYEMTFISGQERSLSTRGCCPRLCYYMDWKPDLTLLDFTQIKDYCSSGVDTILAEVRLEQEEDKRLACYAAMLHSLEYRPSEEVLSAKPHLQRYSDWMRHQMSNNITHDIATPEEQWKLRAQDPDYYSALLNKIQTYDAEGAVISSVAKNLPGILRGEVDGLTLLFGDSSLMEQYYHYAHSSTSAFSKIERYVDALAHKNSGIKVLEIGAGTGGATELILQALMRQSSHYGGSPRFVEYVYTDISPSFFEKAKLKFQSALGRMTFATLNIEQDPVEQGFREGEYDLIVASHVGSPANPLENALNPATSRSYMQPRIWKRPCVTHGVCSRGELSSRILPLFWLTLRRGGKLVAYETVTPEAILPAFIFGSLPGWWLGTSILSSAIVSC